MVERTSADGTVIGPDEELTADEALAAYTTGGAYACRAEDRMGSLGAGKYADLVVLGDDPRTVAPSALADIPVVGTMVEGELVHGAL